jgi:hypothetical protein
MMRSRFWQGLIWGSLLGTVLGAIMRPMVQPQRKPLVERSADAIKHTTRDLIREARKARKRIMKKID